MSFPDHPPIAERLAGELMGRAETAFLWEDVARHMKLREHARANA